MTITQGFTPGIAAGGGFPAPPNLHDTVNAAAQALTNLYGGADVQIRFNSNGRSGGAFLLTHPADHFLGNAEVGITADLTPEDTISIAVRLTATAARHGHRIPGDHQWVDNIDTAVAMLTEKANLDASAIKGLIADQQREFEASHVRLGLAVPARSGQPGYLILAADTPEGREYLERVQRSRSRLGILFSSYVDPKPLVINGGVAEFAPGTPFRVTHKVQWKDATTMRLGVVYEVQNGTAVPAGEIKSRQRE
jgi:hypothetical protein